ncbi:restriction endonuclease subunit S [Acinetobacter sp. LH3_13]|uniref:restriction endonuclease subunit S n=1 Tax=Acinetobacter sp. LH3_13 TaxID=3434463 RepID=UPI003EBFE3B9
MAKYQKYAEYKDSGVEWLGEIPNDWINTKVKYEAYVKARVGWHGLKSDDFTDEGPYLVTGSDFKGTNIDWSQCYHCDLPRYEQDPYIQLKDGDLLITKDGTIGKVALVSNLKDDEKATLNSGIFVVRPLRNNFSTKFYFWLLQSKVFKEFVDFNKTGSTIVHLYQDTFVNFEYASPVLEDQIKISNFLDHETTKIDRLIEKQQQLIELLKEKRQAVISHAVTKGLDPNVPMKDSGVAWLGEVPGHWIVMKFNRCVQIRNGLVDPRDNNYKNFILYAPNHIEKATGKILYKETAEEQGADSNKYLCFKGEVVYSKIRPALAKVAICEEDMALCSADMYPMNACNGLTNDFLYHFILSDSFTKAVILDSDRVAMPKINRESLNEYRLPIPPVDEQVKILKYIEISSRKLDELEQKALQAIQLMQERRTALISAAVTGKIDVRHWQAPTVAEADTELSA